MVRDIDSITNLYYSIVKTERSFSIKKAIQTENLLILSWFKFRIWIR
jgi:hypothetical protein